MGQRLSPQCRADRHLDGTQTGDRHPCDNRVEAGVEDDADRVSPGDTQLQQATGEQVGARVPVGVRQVGVVEGQHTTIGRVRSSETHQIGDRRGLARPHVKDLPATVSTWPVR